MWPLGPDVVEECQAVAELPTENAEDWMPLFFPNDFTEEHGPLKVEQYRLTPDELKSWAERCVKIRASIADKAKNCAENEPPPADDLSRDQPRRG